MNPDDVVVRCTQSDDFPQIIQMCREVYPRSPSWTETQLASHLSVFPEGQLVALHESTGQIVGMAASLIIAWDDYDRLDSWRDFTDRGMFTNHDPEKGKTLYGAEVMVRPSRQRAGVGSGELDIRTYVRKVVHGELNDPTLSFQLKHGFRVLAVVSDYLKNDPESLGYAALIEWLNPAQATAEDYARQQQGFDGNLAPTRQESSPEGPVPPKAV
ncbi:MAG: GNAT family N-acetyltransferase [Acidobacteriota bacterium]